MINTPQTMKSIGLSVLLILLSSTQATASLIDPLAPEVNALIVYASFPDKDPRLPAYYRSVETTMEDYFEKVSFGNHRVNITTVIRPVPDQDKCYIADSILGDYQMTLEQRRVQPVRLIPEILKKVSEDNSAIFEGVDVAFFCVKGDLIRNGRLNAFSSFGPKTYVGDIYKRAGVTLEIGEDEGKVLKFMAHEYGHLLGVGHLSGAHGRYSVMGKQNDVLVPYSLNLLRLWGWIGPEKVVEVTRSLWNERIGDIRRDGKLYRININGNPLEYFLIANHQGTDFDAAYGGKGLLIWHILEDGSDNLLRLGNEIWDVEVASGLFNEEGEPDPIAGKDRLDHFHFGDQSSSPSDFFDGVTFTRFSWDTNPNTNGYSRYTEDSPQGVPSGISIENIRAEGGDIIADIIVPSSESLVESNTWGGIKIIFEQ